MKNTYFDTQSRRANQFRRPIGKTGTAEARSYPDLPLFIGLADSERRRLAEAAEVIICAIYPLASGMADLVKIGWIAVVPLYIQLISY